jgi:hypothetical protein
VASIIAGMLCYWLLGRAFKFERKALGGMILAAGFPNVTYLGLPVLEQTFGSWARSVVIQMDLFAASPLLFTLGIVVARHYGNGKSAKSESVWPYLNTPPFWAAGVIELEWRYATNLADWGIKTTVECGRAIDVVFIGAGTKLEGRQDKEHTLYSARRGHQDDPNALVCHVDGRSIADGEQLQSRSRAGSCHAQHGVGHRTMRPLSTR